MGSHPFKGSGYFTALSEELRRHNTRSVECIFQMQNDLQACDRAFEECMKQQGETNGNANDLTEPVIGRLIPVPIPTLTPVISAGVGPLPSRSTLNSFFTNSGGSCA